MRSRAEVLVERFILNSRWLLTPFYLGLVLVVVALAITFFRELWHLYATIFTAGESDVVLTVLALVDVVLVANLLIMVVISGYENFVSDIEVAEGVEKPDWLGKIDAGNLKVKVAAAIVAISSIHLLRAFLNVNEMADSKIILLMVMHMVFVFSALLLAYLDKISSHGPKAH
ncbi:MAG: TIGR00645 family protein [Alphaproteobacteria bacterium]|nr:TIGR00645 family protein [Alphaproteobacteria bacterium]